MSVLFTTLRDRVDENARQAVDVYAREVAGYRQALAATDDTIGLLDFAVFIRRRSVDLAAAARPLGDADLTSIAAVGRQRAELGFSVPSQRQVLGLHTGLMVGEVHDASRPEDVTDLLRMMSWLGAQGVRAREAYLRGYARGVDPSRAAATRLELLARALLADEPTPGPAARAYLVTVVRVAEPLPAAGQADVLRALTPARVPAAWLAPDELVLLTAGDDLQHLRRAVAAAGVPVRAGSESGRTGRLAEALGWAREAAVVAPIEDRPAKLYTVADLFVEMSVARVPRIDAWLGGFGRALATGPDLMATLSAYYENDMNRGAAAAALNIHPRTLDYRLRRVRETTGVDPASATGVRLLSAAVARAGLRRLTNVDADFSVSDEDRPGWASRD